MDSGIPDTPNSTEAGPSHSTDLAVLGGSKTDLLFVNETKDSPTFKAGNRYDIRSHVRSGMVRLSKPHRGGQHRGGQLKWKTVAAPLPRNRSEASAANESDEKDDSASPLTAVSSSHCLSCGEKLYCNTCSGPKRIMQQRAGHGKERRIASPLEVLGASRSDPFSSYPVENPDKSLHELMDFMVTYLVPRLRPDVVPQHGANTVSRSWFKACLKSPLFFHAMAFASSIHLELLRTSKLRLDSPRALSHKLIVIQKLKEVIADKNIVTRDEVILSIYILACHDDITIGEEPRKPFSPPLRRAEWLNVYGNYKCVPEHISAMLSLLKMRGGLEALTLPGLAESIASGVIITAIRTFSKPILPPLLSHGPSVAEVEAWASGPSRLPVKKLATTFHNLRSYSMPDAMLELLDSVGCLTMAINHYLEGTPSGLSLGQLTRGRMAIEERILFLPSFTELDVIPVPVPNVYECCRLTAMIYGVAVCFPIPNTYNILQRYVTDLKVAIEESGLKTCGIQNTNLNGVFLWILVLGGIAALDKMERPWYESQLALLVAKLKIEWDEIEEILETFLWLDSAFHSSARDLWATIELLVF